MNPIGLTSKFFKISTEEKWEAAAEAGFTNVEIVFMMQMGENMTNEADLRRKQVMACGLQPTSAHLPFHFCYDFSCADRQKRMIALEHQRRCLQKISEWQIPIAVVHASTEPVMDAEREVRFGFAQEGIEVLGEYAQTLGVTLALEVLPRTCIGNTSSEIRRLNKNGTVAKVNMDFNHLMRETQMEFIERMGDQIVTTHLSDYDGVIEHHWAPGIGSIAWKKYLDQLIDKGYKGQFMIETQEDIAIPGEIATPERVMKLFSAVRNAE